MLQVDRLLDHGPAELVDKLPDGTFHRQVRNPGADISDLPTDAQRAISDHWTPERVASFEERIALVEQEQEPAPVLTRAQKFDALLRRAGMTSQEFMDELAARSR